MCRLQALSYTFSLSASVTIVLERAIRPTILRWPFISGEVKKASCTCVAGQIGFCNHISVLLMKLCKWRLYECKDVTDLNEEDDTQPTKAYTSTLQL